MQYLLLIYGNEREMLAASEETIRQMVAAYVAYLDAMKQAGIFLGSNRLRPTASARTVRGSNGKATVVDGPFAETKEQLGGYVLIDVPDFDTAQSWAARCPGVARGSVEVRPVWAM